MTCDIYDRNHIFLVINAKYSSKIPSIFFTFYRDYSNQPRTSGATLKDTLSLIASSSVIAITNFGLSTAITATGYLSTQYFPSLEKNLDISNKILRELSFTVCQLKLTNCSIPLHK